MLKLTRLGSPFSRSSSGLGNRRKIYRVSGSHDGGHEEFSLLRYNTASSAEPELLPTCFMLVSCLA